MSSSMIDIRSVKCWYQDEGGLERGVELTGRKVLVPELLLKDDSLVKVENGENYLKLADGSYRWVSKPGKQEWFTTPRPEEFNVKDSDVLQPQL